MSKYITSPYTFTTHDLPLGNHDKEYILKVKDLPEEDKPREKLIARGPGSLSTEELLAVIINVGTRKEEVMSMAKRVVKEYGEKNIATQTNAEAFAKEMDIPLTKACQIVACFELGKRFYSKKPGRRITLRTAKQVHAYLKDMQDLPKEQLRGLYLNSRYQLIHDEVISVGSLTANIVHPREVFKPALECSAVAVIIAHNHPSGSTKPSTSDIETTKQLVHAAKIIGVDLLDHIIIAGNKFASIPVEYE